MKKVLRKVELVERVTPVFYYTSLIDIYINILLFKRDANRLIGKDGQLERTTGNHGVFAKGD